MANTETWPVDENGNPMAKVSMSAQELINLGNYSNATLGPAVVTKFVTDDEEDIVTGLKQCTELVEELVGAERDKLVAELTSK